MPATGWNQDGIADFDGFQFTIDFHRTAAIKDKIKFFGFFMVMAFGGPSFRHRGLGETLIGDRGIGRVEDAADGRAILGGEGDLFGYRSDRHDGFESGNVSCDAYF